MITSITNIGSTLIFTFNSSSCVQNHEEAESKPSRKWIEFYIESNRSWETNRIGMAMRTSIESFLFSLITIPCFFFSLLCYFLLLLFILGVELWRTRLRERTRNSEKSGVIMSMNYVVEWSSGCVIFALFWDFWWNKDEEWWWSLRFEACDLNL